MKTHILISFDEYRSLRYAEAELRLLENGGVDNWTNYSDSLYSDYGEPSIDDLKKEIDEEIETLMV